MDTDAVASTSPPIASLLICLGLIMLLVVVHYGLWLGSNSVPDYVSLTHEISTIHEELDVLEERNNALRTEVVGLKSGFAAVEAQARNDLGFVKQGETFYQIIDHANAGAAPQ